MKFKVGQTVSIVDAKKGYVDKGRIIYVHPERLFCVVKLRNYCEAYWPEKLSIASKNLY